MAQDEESLAVSEEALLPPTAKRRIYEKIALKIREFAGVALDEPLDPWALAPYLKLRVVSIEEIRGLSPESRQVLLGDTSKGWSGGASRPLPDGTRLVFLNPNHSRERQAATLMEEISHVILGHSPSRIQTEAFTSAQRVRFRDFNEAQEEVAYAVGAASLVPYFSLRLAVEANMGSETVAQRFGVSKELVDYRLKVCRLWSAHRARKLA
jgi:uncharacterized protein DUF955